MIYNFCTLLDINYLTRGVALYQSLVKHCPDFKLWILCMDDETLKILGKLKLKNVELIYLNEFEDNQLLKAKTTRTHGEYCWTCTPSLPLYILGKNKGLESITYLDSDLYFYSSPQPVYEEMGSDSVLIIPHRIVPWKKDKEKTNGIYNVGMLIFRNDKEGRRCLTWWREKCLDWCYYKIEKDRMGDQKYLDQFPKLFKNVHVLKHLGAGVAPWNIRQYTISQKGSDIFINGDKLIFYHYGGLEIFPHIRGLNAAALGPYRGKELHHKIIYRPYFDKLYDMAARVRNYEPKFNAGFSKRSFKDFLALNVFNR